jgi:hypothetical protein
MKFITVEAYSAIYKPNGVSLIFTEAELRFAESYAQFILKYFIEESKKVAASKQTASKIIV